MALPCKEGQELVTHRSLAEYGEFAVHHEVPFGNHIHHVLYYSAMEGTCPCAW